MATPQTPERLEITTIFSEERPFLFDFLNEVAPERVALLSDILAELSFPANQVIRIDSELPLNTLGTFGLESGDICLNMHLVLFGTRTQIINTLAHEGTHAGVFTDGIVVSDEALTELLAKRISEADTTTVYDPLVDELWPYLADLSITEITEIIELGHQESLQEFIQLIVLYPLTQSSNPRDFSFESIRGRVHQAWPIIQRLFPRALNEYTSGLLGSDMSSDVSVEQIGIESIVESIAGKLLVTAGAQSLVDYLLSGQIIETKYDAWDIIVLEGFIYLVDLIDDKDLLSRIIERLTEQGFAPTVPNPLVANHIEP